MKFFLRLTSSITLAGLLCTPSFAEDWRGFRGPLGNANAVDGASIPSTWSPSANLAWKTELPGPGASSPIVVGGKAFVTCYSGYGLSQENPGDIKNLVRHLVCIDLASGQKLWQKDVPVTLPEDPYTGIGVTAHGYASHTPVSDGKNVYAFFGKSGVLAYDLNGNKLWQVDVGKESDPTKWGSSSSPVIHDNVLIVTASAESQAIVGLDITTGKEVWRQEAKGLDGMWGTPSLVDVDGKTELVMCVAGEMWGMNPASGKLLWHADATNAQQAYTSLVQNKGRVFAFTGRGGGSIALDAGGSGDVSKTKTVWTGRDTTSFASPVSHKDKLYIVTRGVMTVVNAEDGKRVEQMRLKGAMQTGGRFGSLDYPSPVVAGDRMFYMNGSGQMYVFALGEKTEQIALNRFTSDKEIFWGTPAISNGNLIVRSAKHLYCVKDKGDSVDQDASLFASIDNGDSSEAGSSGGQGSGRSSRSGGSRFDPMSMFNGMDSDKDGQVTEAELEGNRMAERLMTLDKDGDKSISKDEFSSGIASLFSRGGGSGGGGGGRSYGGRGTDKRPDRPQRPSGK
ncbi:MAG: PQQ-binding-like beta-propeller repeat protein [Planctomycetota bacterium]|nr:PQQ-binding-like beta-propeller repeat protein [Planctomycetota bacterium]